MLLETVEESAHSQHWHASEQVTEGTHVCSGKWTSYQNHELREIQSVV